MFGFRFIKAQPTQYILQYRKGKVVKEGEGLSFFYFSSTTSLVRIPMASIDAPFIFKEVTSDFQEISIQGQITYRIADPKKISQFLNFTIDGHPYRYISDDIEKLPQRVINAVQVLMKAELQTLPLKDVLISSEKLVQKMRQSLAASEIITTLGLELLGLSILAIKPNPDTARALEAEAREQLLRDADEAIYARRNAAVEQERAIKENELNTERMIQDKKFQMRKQEFDGQILLEEKNRDLVALSAENSKREADAKAYGIETSAKALSGIDAGVLQSLASIGMDPSHLIAIAFRELAQNADKIGQLNISPDLLRELIQKESAG